MKQDKNQWLTEAFNRQYNTFYEKYLQPLVSLNPKYFEEANRFYVLPSKTKVLEAFPRPKQADIASAQPYSMSEKKDMKEKVAEKYQGMQKEWHALFSVKEKLDQVIALSTDDTLNHAQLWQNFVASPKIQQIVQKNPTKFNMLSKQGEAYVLEKAGSSADIDSFKGALFEYLSGDSQLEKAVRAAKWSELVGGKKKTDWETCFQETFMQAVIVAKVAIGGLKMFVKNNQGKYELKKDFFKLRWNVKKKYYPFKSDKEQKEFMQAYLSGGLSAEKSSEKQWNAFLKNELVQSIVAAKSSDFTMLKQQGKGKDAVYQISVAGKDKNVSGYPFATETEKEQCMASLDKHMLEWQGFSELEQISDVPSVKPIKRDGSDKVKTDIAQNPFKASKQDITWYFEQQSALLDGKDPASMKAMFLKKDWSDRERGYLSIGALPGSKAYVEKAFESYQETPAYAKLVAVQHDKIETALGGEKGYATAITQHNWSKQVRKAVGAHDVPDNEMLRMDLGLLLKGEEVRGDALSSVDVKIIVEANALLRKVSTANDGVGVVQKNKKLSKDQRQTMLSGLGFSELTAVTKQDVLVKIDAEIAEVDEMIGKVEALYNKSTRYKALMDDLGLLEDKILISENSDLDHLKTKLEKFITKHKDYYACDKTEQCREKYAGNPEFTSYKEALTKFKKYVEGKKFSSQKTGKSQSASSMDTGSKDSLWTRLVRFVKQVFQTLFGDKTESQKPLLSKTEATPVPSKAIESNRGPVPSVPLPSDQQHREDASADNVNTPGP